MKTNKIYAFLWAITLGLALPLCVSAQRVLTLEECVRLAKANNRTLQKAALDIRAAGEGQREAYTKYFPEISANVTAFQAFDKMLKGDGTIPAEVAALGEPFAAMAGQPYSFGEMNRGYSATLSAMLPIYAGGQITTGNRLAALQTDVVRLQLDLSERDVERRVTEIFFQIATVKANLRTLDAADRQVAEMQKMVSDFLRAGLVARNDLLKVQLRAHELASSRLQLENAAHVLRLLLAQAVGLGLEDVDTPEESLTVENPASLFVDGAGAASRRSELLLSEKAVEAASLGLRMERGRLLPTVAVGVVGYQAGLGGFSSNVKRGFDTSFTNGLVLGTVSIPISAWWGGRHALRRQKIRLQQSQLDAEEAREMLTIDIEQARTALTEAFLQVEIAEKSVEQAAENLRMTSDQFGAGTIALTDLLDAETLNRQALSRLATAKATFMTARCQYLLKTR